MTVHVLQLVAVSAAVWWREEDPCLGCGGRDHANRYNIWNKREGEYGRPQVLDAYGDAQLVRFAAEVLLVARPARIFFAPCEDPGTKMHTSVAGANMR